MSIPVTSGIKSVKAVTPSDADDLETSLGAEHYKTTKGIRVTVAGDVAMVFAEDSAAVVFALEAGRDYPYYIKKVMATNTDATGIFALY